jgi:hypothetical protein
MRRAIRRQLALVPLVIDPEHSREVAAIGVVLDAHPRLVRLLTPLLDLASWPSWSSTICCARA